MVVFDLLEKPAKMVWLSFIMIWRWCVCFDNDESDLCMIENVTEKENL